MQKFDFGGGVFIERPSPQTQERGLTDIEPQQIVEIVQVAVTVFQALKILIASIKSTFFKK